MKAIAYRVVSENGTTLTDWIDGDPGDDKPMQEGARFEKAYPDARIPTIQASLDVSPEIRELREKAYEGVDSETLSFALEMADQYGFARVGDDHYIAHEYDLVGMMLVLGYARRTLQQKVDAIIDILNSTGDNAEKLSMITGIAEWGLTGYVNAQGHDESKQIIINTPSGRKMVLHELGDDDA